MHRKAHGSATRHSNPNNNNNNESTENETISHRQVNSFVLSSFPAHHQHHHHHHHMPRCRVFLSRPYCFFLLFLKLQEVEINESRADGVVDAVMMQQQSPTQQRKKEKSIRSSL